MSARTRPGPITRRCANCGAWSSLLYDVGGRIRVCHDCYQGKPPKVRPVQYELDIPEQFR